MKPPLFVLLALSALLTPSSQADTPAPLAPEFASLPATQGAALASASTVVTYKTVDGLALDMHLFLPPKPAASSAPRPAVLFIHGGGWAGGDPSVHAFEGAWLARQGMVVATIRYRLLGDPAKNRFATARSPADCLADAKSALRFLRAHAAEYHIDPERIAAGGGSAGGHLAAALNTIDGHDDPADDLSVSPKVAALVLTCPAFDLVNGWRGGGEPCQRTGIPPRAFSPALLAGPDFPPTLILVGALDPVSPPASNAAFVERMKTAGVRVELLTYADKKHQLYVREKTDPHFQAYLIHTSRFFQDLGWLPRRPLPPLPDLPHTLSASP